MPATLEDKLFKLLQTQDADVLRDRLRQRDELAQIKQKLGPQTKKELWEVLKEKCGVELSTVAVCPGHSSQLDMVWEVYSFEVRNVLWVMSRGGGKTSLAAWMDEIQAEFWPGWASFCVPMDAEILTRNGWCAFNQLQPGVDETIGFNPKTMRSEWTPVLDKTMFRDRQTHTVGNKLWKARVTEGHTWSVTDRGYRTGKKGPGTEEVLRSFEDLRLNDRVRLACKAEAGNLDITPQEAAVIGWLWGDGHCTTRMEANHRRTFNWGFDKGERLGKASILQAKPDGVGALRTLLRDVPHSESRPQAGVLDHHHVKYEFRLDPAWVRDVLKRGGLGDDLWSFVTGLTEEAREGLLSGFLGAEGWVMSDKRYAGEGTRCFAQNEGPVLDAMVLCSYLCGYRPTMNANDRSSFKANAINWQVMLCKPHSYAGRLKSTPGEIEDVWCPTTGLGTWTMRWNDQVLLTGNTIGANKTQGDRKYEYLLPLVVEGGVIGGKELDHVIRSTATETNFKNGSKVEIALGGSPEQANGPRTPRLHRDEVEQMRRDTFKQAANIPAGRKMRDGRYAPAQWLDTSTMKGAEGHVDLAIQAYNKAIEKGVRPAQEVRICCIFEVAEENPACRSVPEEDRRARLLELGRDPDELCICDSYVQDVWPAEEDADNEDAEPEPRTLESVCQGRFFRSRGHKEFGDVQGLFLANDRETWNAEQECSQPSTEGAFIRSYNQTRNGIRGYSPDPENGPVYTSTDWGTGDEAWHGWFQVLEREVTVRGFKGDGVRTLPVGALVVFAEIYRAGMGNVELGQKVLEREAEWILEYPGWSVQERYYDNALLGAAADWRDQLGMKMTNRIRKDFKEELKLVRTRVGTRGGLYVDIIACEWFDKSIRAWKQVNGREVHDFASHAMAGWRYLEHNLHVIMRKLVRAGRAGRGNGPRAAGDEMVRAEERQKEMAASFQTSPLRGNGTTIAVIGGPPRSERETIGDVGAEDSPHRLAGHSMGGFGGSAR